MFADYVALFIILDQIENNKLITHDSLIIITYYFFSSEL